MKTPNDPAVHEDHGSSVTVTAREKVPERTSGSSTPALRAVGIVKHFAHHCAVDRVSLQVSAGEVLCIIGPSGSGKSTLLRCMGLLEEFEQGGLYLEGNLLGYRQSPRGLKKLPERELVKQRTELGIVFQHFNLFGHMTALQNVISGPVWVRGESKAKAIERGRSLLTRVGLQDHEHAYPSQLSGGQQQRVAIARCLAMRPKIVMFDEPTSALDPELVGEVLSVIKDLAADGMTMIVVTHEIGFAREVADRVLFMHSGAVCAEGPPSSLFNDPPDPQLRDFLSKVL